MSLIEIDLLSHRYSDGTVGLRNVTLTIRQGAFVLLAGPNGSGKTTLLKHFNGLLVPGSGTVKLAGRGVSENLVETRQKVGMVFQDADSQIVGETVYDDAAFGPENLCLQRSEIDRRVKAALQAVGLTHLSDQRPHLLSAGEKRRLTIAGILAMNPRIILFDEPFSNLDFPGLKQVLHQILMLHKKGHTILMATHDLDPVIDHADRLIIMDAGAVARDGHPHDLIHDIEAFGVRAPYAYRPVKEARSCRR